MTTNVAGVMGGILGQDMALVENQMPSGAEVTVTHPLFCDNCTMEMYAMTRTLSQGCVSSPHCPHKFLFI